MRVHHLALTVRNQEQSVQFYRDIIGFRVLREFTKPGWNGKAIVLARDDLQIEIFCFDSVDATAARGINLHRVRINHLGFTVTEIHATYQDLLRLGVRAQPPQPGTTCTAFFFVEDPDGNVIEFMQPY